MSSTETANALFKAIKGDEIAQPATPVNAQNLMGVFQTQPTEPALSWWDVPVKAAANIVPSAVQMGKGIVEAVSSPVETTKNIWDLAAGTLRNVTPKQIAEWIDKADKNKEAATHASTVADMVGQFYKDRYGSVEGFKKAVAYDPVSVLSDLSAVFGGAGAIGGATKAGQVMTKAAELTNPIQIAAKAVTPVVKTGLGVLTGTSPETIAGAARAGAAGDKTFQQNLRGTAEMTDVLDNAKYNLNLMRQSKNNAYRSGMIDIKNDATELNFKDVDKALDRLKASATFKGEIVNPTAYKLYEDLSNTVKDWKALPANEYHTPEGFDALKQRMGDAIESVEIGSKARTMGNNVYNSVKQTINSQAPTYANVMRDYADASDQIRQIEQTLSLGHKSSVDTALRKLQSLTRNNVSTNYGQRMTLAQELESQPGARPFISALHGQALSSPTARGMAGTLEGATGVLGAVTNPAALAVLPFQTPRLVGEGLYYGGRAGQGLKNVAGAVGLTPQTGNALADLLYLENQNRGQQ